MIEHALTIYVRQRPHAFVIQTRVRYRPTNRKDRERQFVAGS